MRVVIFIGALIVAGCASQGAQAPPAASKVTKIAPADAKPIQTAAVGLAAPSDKKINTDTLVNAKKLGYTVVDQDGDTLFCRKELKTGSHVQRETVCLTAKQIEDLRLETQQRMENFSRQVAPPSGR